MVGSVVFANEETILVSDDTLFVVPAAMRLPQYEILEGRNVLAHVPEVRA